MAILAAYKGLLYIGITSKDRSTGTLTRNRFSAFCREDIDGYITRANRQVISIWLFKQRRSHPAAAAAETHSGRYSIVLLRQSIFRQSILGNQGPPPQSRLATQELSEGQSGRMNVWWERMIVWGWHLIGAFVLSLLYKPPLLQPNSTLSNECGAGLGYSGCLCRAYFLNEISDVIMSKG